MSGSERRLPIQEILIRLREFLLKFLMLPVCCTPEVLSTLATLHLL